MMSIELNPPLELVDWKRISELFRLVNWGERDPKEIEKAYRISSVTCFAMHENEIIGFGRTIHDGRF